ncbi:hypothetical protein [Pelagibius sp.]|nr:hypothetical protein [Pelagibius sp.]
MRRSRRWWIAALAATFLSLLAAFASHLAQAEERCAAVPPAAPALVHER